MSTAKLTAIENGESGSSVREKVNNVISFAVESQQAQQVYDTEMKTAKEKVAFLLASGAKYMGVATVDGIPQMSENSIFYYAPMSAEVKIYENFGGLLIPPNTCAFLVFNIERGARWIADILYHLDDAPTHGSANSVTSEGVAAAIEREAKAREEADKAVLQSLENNVLYFELNESTGEIVATTGGESVYKSITMSEDTGEIEVEQEV